MCVCACIQPHTRTSMQKEGVAGEPGAQRRTRSTTCKLWPEELAIFGEKVAGLLPGTARQLGGEHPAEPLHHRQVLRFTHTRY